MKKLFAVILLFSLLSVRAAEPLLRFGAISDNHLDSRKPDSWERTKMAFEFFKKHQLIFFVDAGDVTDAVAVAVAEAAGIDLVDCGSFPPFVHIPDRPFA